MEANCLFCYNLRVRDGYSGYGTKKIHVGKCSEKGISIFKYKRRCSFFSKIGSHYPDVIKHVKRMGDRLLYVHQLMVENAPEVYKEAEG